MGKQETNYPLHQFDIRMFAASVPAYLIGRAVGIPSVHLRWHEFGVRELAVTADLLVPEKYAKHKLGIFNAVANLPHSGERTLRNTSVRWDSGSKETQLYSKAEQLRRVMGRGAYQRLLQERPELPRVLRLEVTLGSADIRHLFGLRPGWLPMLPLITPKVAAYVLSQEVRKRFRLDRSITVATTAQDTTAGLAGALLAAAEKRGEKLTFSALCQLVSTHQLLAVHGTGKRLRDLFGPSSAQIGKLRRRLEKLGFPPGSAPDSFSHACVGLFRTMFLEQYPSRVRKPVLTHEQEHGMSIDSPWLDGHDTSRELDGMSVVEFEPAPLPLDAPGIGFGVRVLRQAHHQIEASP